MTQRFNGIQIERHIKELFKLEEPQTGFDATWHNKPVEIKSCVKWHRNGVTKSGKQNWTRGRYWINNTAHKLLLDENGIYIFVLYEEDHCYIRIHEIRILSAKTVDLLIGKGENTKIKWNKVI